jgi:hypothetical protein
MKVFFTRGNITQLVLTTPCHLAPLAAPASQQRMQNADPYTQDGHTDAGCGRVALSQKKWSHSSNQEARDMNRLAAHGSAPRKWHVQIPQRPVLGLAGVLLAR